MAVPADIFSLYIKYPSTNNTPKYIVTLNDNEKPVNKSLVTDVISSRFSE